jgi:hypothetical protein
LLAKIHNERKACAPAHTKKSSLFRRFWAYKDEKGRESGGLAASNGVSTPFALS